MTLGIYMPPKYIVLIKYIVILKFIQAERRFPNFRDIFFEFREDDGEITQNKI